jgi:hypothetical protein
VIEDSKKNFHLDENKSFLIMLVVFSPKSLILERQAFNKWMIAL